MSNTKIVSLFLIVLGGTGLYLHSQGKLIPAVEVITAKGSGLALGKWVVAFLVYLFILSLLSQSEGMILTITILMGALIASKTKGVTVE